MDRLAWACAPIICTCCGDSNLPMITMPNDRPPVLPSSIGAAAIIMTP
jgi:hypothetical protein